MKKRVAKLTIGEAAEFLGVHPDTLRLWELKKVLIPYRSPETGWRYYYPKALAKFKAKYERT